MKLKTKTVLLTVSLLIIFAGAVSIMIPMSGFADTDTTPPTGYIPSLGDGSMPTPISNNYSLGVLTMDNVAISYAEVYLGDYKLSLPSQGIGLESTQTLSGTFFNLKWDTTQVANGQYKLQLKIYDTSGNAAWATANDNDYVTYSVNNPIVVHSTPETTNEGDSTTTPSTCNGSQDDVNSLVQGIVDRKNKHLESMNKAEIAFETYYVKNHGDVKRYQTELGAVYLTQVQAADALDSLKQINSINCSNNPKQQLTEFKVSLDATTDAMNDYQAALQALTRKIDEVIK
jgi:hypothetical protein